MNEQQRPKFRTKRGHLTHYALACGYLEVTTGYNSAERYLYLEKEGCFHVRGRIGDVGVWESFDRMIDARNRFMGLVREHRLVRKKGQINE